MRSKAPGFGSLRAQDKILNPSGLYFRMVKGLGPVDLEIPKRQAERDARSLVSELSGFRLLEDFGGSGFEKEVFGTEAADA